MQKRIWLCLIVFIVLATTAVAQLHPTELDKSPMDMSYSPNGYPILRFQGKATAQPNARVIYSRPQKRGRDIFGSETKYNEVWRLGANENTEIEFFKDAVFGGKKIAKGRYSMFCIPEADEWTIIINKDNDNWGNFNYNAKNDVLRVTAPVQTTELVENFTIYFDDASLCMTWENVKVNVPVSFPVPLKSKPVKK